jgi:Immunity protein 27
MKSLINSEEFKLKGSWLFENNKVVEDAICRRINDLKNNYLIKISTSVSGWETLYQDPSDKRYWELIFEQNEFQGGGAPTLVNISKEAIKEKYNIDLDFT